MGVADARSTVTGVWSGTSTETFWVTVGVAVATVVVISISVIMWVVSTIMVIIWVVMAAHVVVVVSVTVTVVVSMRVVIIAVRVVIIAVRVVVIMRVVVIVSIIFGVIVSIISMVVVEVLEVVGTIVAVWQAVSITVDIIGVVLFGELLLVGGWGLGIETIVTFLTSVWVVTGTESCAPWGVDDTVVAVCSGWTVTAITERVTITSVVTTVGAVPVWKTLACTSNHFGVVGTANAIRWGDIESNTWVIADVASQVALLCTVITSPSCNTLTVFAIWVAWLVDELSACNAVETVFGSNTGTACITTHGVTFKRGGYR
jgi:hypothetical protein